MASTSGQNQQTPAAISDNVLSDAVKEAWRLRCSSLGEDEKKKFESFACKGLPDYLQQLELACQAHEAESHVFRMFDWFEPLFKAMELFTPAATTSIQAYPNPGALVLGGILAILNTTNRLLAFQKLTLQMLSKMGRRARILLDYEKHLYQNDLPVQQALIDVYGDIIIFCQKAFSFLTKDGKVRAKVKGLKLIFFRDYESQLGVEVQNFEGHMEDLEFRAALCDKRRLKDLHEGQKDDSTHVNQLLTESRDHFQRQERAYKKFFQIETALREQADRQKKKKEQRKMHRWLSNISFSLVYDQKCEEHLDGTGTWLLESTTYKSWKRRLSSELLWIKGKPGCGKSVLAALACTDLKLDLQPGMSLAYVFCRREDESAQDERSIWGAVVRQLIQYLGNTDPVLLAEYQKSGPDEKPGKTTILAILRSVLAKSSQTFIIIDGLDECKDHQRFAGSLHQLVQSQQSNATKILVFSRYDSALEDLFQPYQQIQPDQGENEQDLKAYISSLFPDDATTSVESLIREQCMDKADGMFLWVKLLAENLPKSLLPNQKLKRIEKVPRGLDNMYDQILEDIWAQEEDLRSTAILVLFWVTSAARPLTQDEMLEATADYSDAERWDQIYKHTNPQHLVSSCMNLVFIDKEGIFRLCHESVRGHFARAGSGLSRALQEYQKLQEGAHMRLSKICLGYLLLDDFECGVIRSRGRYHFLRRKYRFLEYAAAYWGLHVLQADHVELQNLVMQIVSSPPRRALSLQLHSYSQRPNLARVELLSSYESSEPMDILAAFGLREIAENIDEMKGLFLGSSHIPGDLLALAVDNLHRDMALWLIQMASGLHRLIPTRHGRIMVIHAMTTYGWGSALNVSFDEDKSLIDTKHPVLGMTPLGTACKSDDVEVVELLLNHGSSINLKNEHGSTPLIIASLYQNPRIVSLLLKRGADPSLPDSYGYSALHYAARGGNEQIIAALLNHESGIRQIEACIGDLSPVHFATEKDLPGIIDMLEKAGFPLDAKTNFGWQPLHYAANGNCVRAAQFLLSKSVPEAPQHKGGGTPLYEAVLAENFRMVKILMDVGSDPNIATAQGRTALHEAVGPSCLSILRYLMKKTAPESWKGMINKKTAEKKLTPLHIAITKGSLDTVKLLLKNGADPTAVDINGLNPLHYAMQLDYPELVRPLMRQMKDVGQQSLTGTTALIIAAQYGYIGYIQEMLQFCSEKGLDPGLDVQDNMGQTALMAALINEHERIATLLLDQGSTSIKTIDGNYPSHVASHCGYLSLVQRLANHTNMVQGHRSRTPLLCGALRGHLEVVEFLNTNFPGMVNVLDDSGRSALYTALTGKHLEVVHYLLRQGVDLDFVDEEGNSLIHVAVEIGDAETLRRLLQAGCKGDMENDMGSKPFHSAVRQGNKEILDVLIAHGLDSTNDVTYNCQTCAMIAVEEGDTEMLLKLKDLGAMLDAEDSMGRTAVFYAAVRGHWRLLETLRGFGLDLFMPDIEGNTSLAVAAAHGHATTVQYLINISPRLVNIIRWTDDAIPLTDAAKCNMPSTISVLLRNGADGLRCDALGLTPLDYAENHVPSLREFHKLLLFSGAIDGAEKVAIRRKAICDWAQNILAIEGSDDVRDVVLIVPGYLVLLLQALILEQDYLSAKLCALTIHCSVNGSACQVSLNCSCCQGALSSELSYVCKSCLVVNVLCEQCYDNYNEAGQKIPSGLKQIQQLEVKTRALRHVCDINDQFSMPEWFRQICLATQVFKPIIAWIDDMIVQYKAWGKQQASKKGLYRDVDYPGYKFLLILRDIQWLAAKDYSGVELTQAEMACYAAGAETYVNHVRAWDPKQEPLAFCCENHSYMRLDSAELKAEMVKDINIDSSTGRLKPSFFHRLQEKYSNSSTGKRRIAAKDLESHYLNCGLAADEHEERDKAERQSTIRRSTSLTAISMHNLVRQRRSSFDFASYMLSRRDSSVHNDLSHSESSEVDQPEIIKHGLSPVVDEAGPSEVCRLQNWDRDNDESAISASPEEKLLNSMSGEVVVDASLPDKIHTEQEHLTDCENVDEVVDTESHHDTSSNAEASTVPPVLPEADTVLLNPFLQGSMAFTPDEEAEFATLQSLYSVDHPGKVDRQKFASWILAMHMAAAIIPEVLEPWILEKQAVIDEAQEWALDEAKAANGRVADSSGNGDDEVSIDSIDSSDTSDNNSNNG